MTALNEVEGVRIKRNVTRNREPIEISTSDGQTLFPGRLRVLVQEGVFVDGKRARKPSQFSMPGKQSEHLSRVFEGGFK